MTRVTYYCFCPANDGSINKNWQIRGRKTNYFWRDISDSIKLISVCTREHGKIASGTIQDTGFNDTAIQNKQKICLFFFIRKCFVSLNFAFAHKSCVPTKKLHSLAKVLHPSKKLCVLHLNSPRKLFDYSQKVYITPSVGLGYLDLDLLYCNYK